jgi:hypothetical protein
MFEACHPQVSRITTSPQRAAAKQHNRRLKSMSLGGASSSSGSRDQGQIRMGMMM